MRSRLVPVLFPLVLIGLIFSGMFAYGGLDDFMAQFKPAVEYGVEYADEYEAGKVFKGDIYAVLDSFASYETWKETENGARTEAKTTHEYFIIPAGEAEYVAIKVKADDLDAFYDISDATYAYLMDETAELENTPFTARLLLKRWTTSFTATLLSGLPIQNF